MPLPTGRSRRNAVLGGITLAAVVVAGLALSAFWRVRHVEVTGEHARNVLLPAIEESLAEAPYGNARLLDMALEAESALPHDHTLAKLWPLIARTLTIETQPAGAGVFGKEYAMALRPFHRVPKAVRYRESTLRLCTCDKARGSRARPGRQA